MDPIDIDDRLVDVFRAAGYAGLIVVPLQTITAFALAVAAMAIWGDWSGWEDDDGR